ncbi:MAG: hypothetical protein ACD_43C00034G0001 [uncultured bacterium]|nr:MAG: hypothetical protein ACD_43C00034G0001 [uncultured bacterium]
MIMEFTHLHVHSEYSLLDGLPSIAQLVDHAKKQGYPALALTDHGSLYGIVEFYETCLKANIKPIIGVELYVAQRGLNDRQPRLDDKPYHLVVLAETSEGYRNLLKLVTMANLQGYYYKPRVDLETLAKYHNGLIALSACLNGQIARTILQQDLAAATRIVTQYKQIFGEHNFFLEIQQHPSLPAQAIVNQGLVALSQQTKTPLVATADSHYLKPDDADAQDVLVCIQTKHQLADDKRLSMRSEDYSLASAAEMAKRFADYPDAVTQSNVIAERCHAEIELGKIQLPFYALPQGVTADQALRELCVSAIPKRYSTEQSAAALERLNYELEVIGKTGFASYFLIVQDFVNWAKQQKIVVGPGRGSAAGSIVAYLAGITNIDPLRYELLFERFLNPERVSMPDIDLDFADSRRDEVIRYVESRYGKDHVAQIITFGTMAARAALRDVGRVMGLSYGFCDTIAKMIPLMSSLNEALANVAELQQLYQEDTDAARLIDMAKKLEGCVRHTSTHACGVVITKEPLDHYTPTQYASSDDRNIVTQYSLHPIERLGLLKMDFLGLKNLTIIEQSIELIEKTTGEQIDIDQLPLNDKPSYRLLQKGQTTGIFQLESSGMKRYLRELRPTEFEDIIAMVALYRPGPMERIPEYIAGKHGKRTVTYVVPQLKPVLEKTYGILVYQEQVMALARDVAGFTAGEGYLLIKAVAKKIESLLNEQKHKFIAGCLRNQVNKAVAEQLWEFVEPFAHYGFNKSHSTGYALIAYQTAYLKANYPAQFIASLLTSDAADSERVAIEVQEARELGIAVLSPDVNESFSTFTVVKESLKTPEPRIRFGLTAIKNVGQNLVTAIISERKTHGQFTSLENFLQRLQHKDLNKKSLESLIKSGACLDFGEAAQLLENVETLLQYNRQAQQERLSGQGNLFSLNGVQHVPKLHLTPAAPVQQRQKLEWEKDLLGLYITAHPLEKLQTYLGKQFMTLAAAQQLKHNSPIDCVVIAQTIKRVRTKTNDSMMFARMTDPTTELEAIIFPKVVQSMKTVLCDGAVVRLKGKISKRNGECKIIAEDVLAWPDECLVIQISDTTDRSAISTVKTILQKFPGQLPCYLTVDNKVMSLKQRVDHSAVTDLQKLLGAQAVVLI